MSKRSRRESTDERGELTRWRLDLLLAAGLEPVIAREVAGDAGYDLHRLLELVDYGCPPAVAVRIVAPLDRGVAA